MLKKLDLDDAAPWRQRFRAPRVFSTQVAPANPACGLAVSNRHSHAFQLCAWDVPAGSLRPLTDQPGGKLEGWLSPDGRHVYYLQDQGGDEIGHIVRMPFAGGEPEDVTPQMTPYTLRGFEISRAGNLLAFNPINQDGFQLCCIRLGPHGEHGLPRLIYRSDDEASKSILSCNGEIVTIQSSERAGGKRRYSMLAFDAESGEPAGELWDGSECSIESATWSPVKGDLRLLAATTRTGFKRPLIWNVRTGERADLDIPELEGEVTPLDWSADGKRLLLIHFHQAAQQLYVYDLADHHLLRLNHPKGTFGLYGGYLGKQAYFAPGDEIFAQWQDASHPLELVALNGETGAQTRTVLAAGQAPPSHAWQSITFASSDGKEIQGWLGLPDGRGPFPTILEMHGGPHIVMTECFHPVSQAWLDHGFAFLTINFRGSTTFGRTFQEKIWGDIGHWELEDMVAARNWLVERGIARPDAILLSGESYGGYLTLWGLGKRPDLWAGGLAVVAIADFTLAYEDASDALKGAMRAWFGGSPSEKPEQYAASSPITYAEDVRAPVLILQGRNDSRCPARQMERYEARLMSLGKPIEVNWFDIGHGFADAELSIQFQERMLKFAYRISSRELGGV